MSLNKTHIEWTDYTWNPITGCKNGCPYCYARKIALRFQGGFEPAVHTERMFDPDGMKKPSKIFACSMGEWFGEWVPQQWFDWCIEAIRRNPIHQFQVLTKCNTQIPVKLAKYKNRIPNNMWIGVSVVNEENLIKLNDLMFAQGGIRFVSFEPLHGDINLEKEAIADWVFSTIDWVIVGAETGNRKGKITPQPEWVEKLVDKCAEYKKPIFMKNNLKQYYDGEIKQEFPQGMLLDTQEA